MLMMLPAERCLSMRPVGDVSSPVGHVQWMFMLLSPRLGLVHLADLLNNRGSQSTSFCSLFLVMA